MTGYPSAVLVLCKICVRNTLTCWTLSQPGCLVSFSSIFLIALEVLHRKRKQKAQAGAQAVPRKPNLLSGNFAVGVEVNALRVGSSTTRLGLRLLVLQIHQQ